MIGRTFACAIYFSRCIPTVLPVIIFSTYILLGYQLYAVQAFVTIQLLNILNKPIQMINSIASEVANCTVSASRIMKFLQKNEIIKYVNNNMKDYNELNEIVIDIDNANLGWLEMEKMPSSKDINTNIDTISNSKKIKEYELISTTYKDLDKDLNNDLNKDLESDLENSDTNKSLSNRSIYTLSNISLKIKKGQLIGVVGKVGSGKTSLLNSLLNELYLQNGSISLFGSIAYHQQNPWVFNDRY